MSNLYIFDLLPFIHAGNVNKRSRFTHLVDTGSRCYSVIMPAGGVSLVFNELYNIVGTGDIVVCSDRRPTIKQGMYKPYKANRQHNEEIRVARDVAEYVLTKCNCTVLHRTGYEADDYIYSLVRKFHEDYDNIYIYTGDSDLYFLVDEKVSIRPSSSRAKSVNMDNYETIIHKDHRTRYNANTFVKIVCGDSSDNVPGVPRAWFDKVCDIMYSDRMLPHLGEKSTVRYWIDALCPEMVPQVDLIFPLDAPPEDLPNTFTELDKNLIRNLGAAMNNKMYRGTGDDDFDIAPYVEELYSIGAYLEGNE